jgi:hypothetical protein
VFLDVRHYLCIRTGDWQIKELGKITARTGQNDYVSLFEHGFAIGDFMDVAVSVQAERRFRF